MTGLVIYFFNVPGAMMRVLNCFTRRGLLMEAVWCIPFEGRHRATVLTTAAPITMEQIVRELESTVGVERVVTLEKTQVEQLAKFESPTIPSTTTTV